MYDKIMISFLAIFLSLGCFMGCGTIGTRSGSEHFLAADSVYEATRYDIFFWTIFCLPGQEKNNHYLDDMCDYSKIKQYFVTPVITGIVLVDIIPSIAFDTVLFPYDYYVNEK